eukprot:scaffold3728_cov417-Prasinococcus_capsulatus_cf.AAC.2
MDVSLKNQAPSNCVKGCWPALQLPSTGIKGVLTEEFLGANGRPGLGPRGTPRVVHAHRCVKVELHGKLVPMPVAFCPWVGAGPPGE